MIAGLAVANLLQDCWNSIGLAGGWVASRDGSLSSYLILASDA